MLSNQAEFVSVLGADGQRRRREGGSSQSLSLHLSLFVGEASGDGQLSRQRIQAIPACRSVASRLRLGEFTVFKNLCHCRITILDMAKANTLYLSFKSVAGTKSRFSGRGQDRK